MLRMNFRSQTRHAQRAIDNRNLRLSRSKSWSGPNSMSVSAKSRTNFNAVAKMQRSGGREFGIRQIEFGMS
jgi:hypothetical protein